MKKTRKLFYFLSISFVLSFSLQSAADNILLNPGFEEPVLAYTNGWYGSIDGWLLGGTPSFGTTWAHPFNATTPCPEGNQHVWGSANQLYLYQEPLTIQSDTLYTFSVDLYRMDPQGDANVAYVGFVDATEGGFLALKEYSTTTKNFTFLTDQWTRVTVQFNSSDAPAKVGNTLRVIVDSWQCAIDNASLTTNSAVQTFYISSSTGSDANDGLSPATAWQSFDNINGRTLSPGESVLLYRGDEWRQELHLTGNGTADKPIILADYGLAGLDKPRIRRYDIEYDKCVVISNASHWVIHDIDARHAKIGLYLTYIQNYFNTNITVYDCHFEDMPDTTLDPAKHNYQLAWSHGIFIGGSAGGLLGDVKNTYTVIDGVLVSNCTFTTCAVGFGSAWYHPPPLFNRVRNVTMIDCIADKCIMGAFSFININHCHIERVRAINGGGVDTWCGSTLAMVQSCQNLVVENCEFAFMDRANSGDGCGFDFEGRCLDCLFKDVVIHDCDAPAVINLTTMGANTNIVFENCTFYNNARNPWNNEAACEMYCGYSGNIGVVSNCGLYTGWNADSYLSPSWNGHVFYDMRYASFQSVYNRPSWWDWNTDGDLEGWGSENHLSGISVYGGALHATSSDVDPFILSPPTWTPALATRYVWIRMSQTAGTHAQIFWITETDAMWDGAKSIFFPINPDGAMHEYIVDLGSADARGVITQIRLDPTIVAGSDMAIDFVRMIEDSNNLPSSAPSPRIDWPQQMTLTGQTIDNWVLESSFGSNVGGSIGNSSYTTVRAGDSAANTAYRTVLSFDTSALPDNATIIDATLAVRRQSVTGKSPWVYDGTLVDSDYCEIDMVVPYFGSSSAVEISDWQANASLTNVGRYIIAFKDGLQVREQISSNACALINTGTGGSAQFRLGFPGKTNGDGVADYVDFGSANSGTPSYRPVLKCNYHTN